MSDKPVTERPTYLQKPEAPGWYECRHYKKREPRICKWWDGRFLCDTPAVFGCNLALDAHEYTDFLGPLVPASAPPKPSGPTEVTERHRAAAEDIYQTGVFERPLDCAMDPPTEINHFAAIIAKHEADPSPTASTDKPFAFAVINQDGYISYHRSEELTKAAQSESDGALIAPLYRHPAPPSEPSAPVPTGEGELRRALETALRQWRGYYSDCNSDDIESGKHAEADLYRYCESIAKHEAPSPAASDREARERELSGEVERLRGALSELLRQTRTAEVLGEWEALDINQSLRKKNRAIVEAAESRARAALHPQPREGE